MANPLKTLTQTFFNIILKFTDKLVMEWRPLKILTLSMGLSIFPGIIQGDTLEDVSRPRAKPPFPPLSGTDSSTNQNLPLPSNQNPQLLSSPQLEPSFASTYPDSNKSLDSTSPPLCNYAGYISIKTPDKCIEPWNTDLKSELEKYNLGHLKTEYVLCGAKNTVRCNPVLYGLRSEHEKNNQCMEGTNDGTSDLGCCVLTDKHDYKTDTESCNNNLALNEGEIDNFINNLTEDPERLAEYLSLAVAVVQNCEVPKEECEVLKSLIKDPLKEGITKLLLEDRTLSCNVMKNLLPTPEFSGMDVLLKFIEEENGESPELTALADTVENLKTWASFDEILKRYSNDDRTTHMINLASLNTQCNYYQEWSKAAANPPKEGIICPQKKANDPPTGKCFRYVKMALLGHDHVNGKTVDDRHIDFKVGGYLAGPLAKNAQADIQNHYENKLKMKNPWVNIRKCPGVSENPKDAPEGSILVYDDVREGKPGHIEIAATINGQRKFISDYIRDYPPLPESRPLTAIMIRVDDKLHREILKNRCPQ